MSEAPGRGFREVDHTADWELEVWAPDFAGLVEEAAAGMASLMGVRPASGPRSRRRLRVEGADREELLVAMLSELALLLESDGLAAVGLDVRELAGALTAEVDCVPAREVRTVVKAVTYHRLAIRESADGLAVNVVFDV